MADNPLEAFRVGAARRGPKAERTPPEPNKLPTETEVARMLAGIDQATTNELVRVFDEATKITGAKMGEVMWCLAMLQARVLASAELGNEQVWVAARFAELVQLALPAMMLAVERAKHGQPGKHPNDA